LDLLDSLPYLEHGRYAIGHSLGGHNAIYTALFDERIKVVVSSCGFDSFLDYYGGDPKNWQHGARLVPGPLHADLAQYRDRLSEIHSTLRNSSARSRRELCGSTHRLGIPISNSRASMKS